MEKPKDGLFPKKRGQLNGRGDEAGRKNKNLGRNKKSTQNLLFSKEKEEVTRPKKKKGRTGAGSEPIRKKEKIGKEEESDFRLGDRLEKCPKRQREKVPRPRHPKQETEETFETGPSRSSIRGEKGTFAGGRGFSAEKIAAE